MGQDVCVCGATATGVEGGGGSGELEEEGMRVRTLGRTNHLACVVCACCGASGGHLHSPRAVAVVHSVPVRGQFASGLCGASLCAGPSHDSALCEPHRELIIR